MEVPVTGSRKTNFVGMDRGQEKFAFLYVVISAVAVGCAMTYSSVAGLSRPQTALLLIGALIGAWATLFTFLEVRRLGQTPTQRAAEVLTGEKETFGALEVKPPTGDPYPHHEDYPESAGFDQSQLTSRIPDSTPFAEALERNKKKQPVAR